LRRYNGIPCSNIQRYMNEISFFYGSFDIIVTPDKRYVFLECNPDGQWKWIEHMHDGEVSKEFSTEINKFF